MGEFTSMSAVLMATTMSEFLTHPFDVIKTKKQIKASYASKVKTPSQLTMFLKYIKNRCVKDLYKGFSPAIIKGIQLQTIRFGLYDIMNHHLSRTLMPAEPKGHSLFLMKLASAFTASFVAGFTTNPWMIIKVRMIADKSGEYKTLRQSFINISRNDGYQEFLKGTSISMVRGIVLSTVELTVYDTFKTIFKTKEGLDLRASFLSSLVASLSGALVSYPLDIVRTLYMYENSGPLNNSRGLKQMGKIVRNVYQSRGVTGFYQGFMPYLSKSLIYGPLFWNSLELFNHVCRTSVLSLNGDGKQH